MIESTTHTAAAVLPDRLQADLLERIAGGELELPMLPSVAWEVTALSAAPDVDVRKLSALIHRDQALAGHVLRVANSPAYMPRIPIVSLQQAISRLGTTALSEIAFAISLHSRVFNVPGYEEVVRTLWQHAVGAAAYAKEIARWRRSNVESAFLCGLLHDIGKPVVLQALLDLQRVSGVAVNAAVVSTAMEAYHAHVGQLIATAWTLPSPVAESITYHHDYLIAPTCTEAVMIIRLADCLSYHLDLPEVFDEDHVRHHPVLADLNFYPDDVETLLSKREAVRTFIEGMS